MEDVSISDDFGLQSDRDDLLKNLTPMSPIGLSLDNFTTLQEASYLEKEIGEGVNFVDSLDDDVVDTRLSGTIVEESENPRFVGEKQLIRPQFQVAAVAINTKVLHPSMLEPLAQILEDDDKNVNDDGGDSGNASSHESSSRDAVEEDDSEKDSRSGGTGDDASANMDLKKTKALLCRLISEAGCLLDTEILEDRRRRLRKIESGLTSIRLFFDAFGDETSVKDRDFRQETSVKLETNDEFFEGSSKYETPSTPVEDRKKRRARPSRFLGYSDDELEKKLSVATEEDWSLSNHFGNKSKKKKKRGRPPLIKNSQAKGKKSAPKAKRIRPIKAKRISESIFLLDVKLEQESKIKSHHLNKLVDNSFIFRCFFCNQSFEKEDQLEKHRRNDCKIKKIICDRCGETLDNFDQVEMHENICDIENRIVTDGDDRDETSDDAETDEKQEKTKTKLVNFREVKVDHCRLCGEELTYEASFTHMEIKHTSYNSCPYCEGVFRKLRDHISKCHNPKPSLFCEVCGKSFITSSSLKGHRLNKHFKDQKKHQCEMCGMSFVFAYMVTNHKRAVHEGVCTREQPKNFRCDVCDRAFRTHDLRRRHRLRVHTRELGEYTCNDCGKVMVEKQAFKRHCLSHSNIRNFSCDVCQKAFKTKENLLQHQRSHLPPKHECDICDKKFIYSCGLKTHKKQAHGDVGNRITQVELKVNRDFHNPSVPQISLQDSLELNSEAIRPQPLSHSQTPPLLQLGVPDLSMHTTMKDMLRQADIHSALRVGL